MADERIDVEVTDKVSANVEKKIRGIGDAAGDAHKYVERLKADLNSINTSQLVKMQASSNSTTRAIAAQMNAQARLTIATSKGAAEDLKAAIAKQRLATETARTEAAQARAATAAANSATASIRAAQAAQRAADASSQLAASQNPVQSELEQTKAAFDRGEVSIRKYVAAIQAERAANATGVGGGAMPRRGPTQDLEEESKKLATVSKNVGHYRANIIAQLNDIGVSLAGGQNPLLVLIQQGSQLSYIASVMDGGFKGLLATIARMLAPFAALAAVMGVLWVSFSKWHNEIAAEHKQELQDYANGLGLTSKEMRKLGDETVTAGGKLKEFDNITITMGDTWNGFWATVKEGLAGFSDEWEATTNFVGKAWDTVTHFLYNAFVGFYGAVVGGMRAIAKIIMNLPSVAKNTILALANGTITVVEWMINKAIDGINGLTGGVRDLLKSFGVDIGNIGHVSFGRFARDGASAFDIIGDEVTGAIKEADKTLTAFGERWEANSVAAAKKRIKGVGDAIIDNRTAPKPKKDSTADPKTQADYINDVTKQLDNELSRMKMLKDEREKQQRLDQIEEEFLKRRMPLDQAQLDVFAKKISAIQDYAYVQAESDRIYEDATGPLRTYNATLQAANDLLAAGKINQARFNQEVVLAGRALEQSNDPLFDLKEAMAAAEVAATMYGKAVDQNNYYESVRQAYLAKGVVLSQSYVAGINAKVDALMRENTALQQQQLIQSTVAEIIDPITQRADMLANEQNYYNELQRLRDQDTINEETYKQGLYALDAKFAEMRLAGASSFFGELASLQNSNVKELAAIGKAAAVAQATIDGFVAVQKALASAPPPWNFALAAAVAVKTGMQVAGILSTNVGSFATGGQFMVEGKGGIDNNNINMNVSRGERVTVETAAQQKANDNGSSGGTNVEVPVEIYNIRDPKEIYDRMGSEEGKRVIFNVLRENPNELRGITNNGAG